MLGAGTFGSVFLATDESNEERYAIKRIQLKECLNDSKNLKSVLEVNMLIRARSPHVVNLCEVIHQQPWVYLVFTFYNKTLLEYASGEYECCRWILKSFMSQLISGVTHIHSVGIIHRDLKPENVMVSKHGIIKIADFGLARAHQNTSPMTTYVSTRWYRAPEILLQSDTYDTSIDVWALGLVISELVCRAPLFPGNTDVDMLHRISQSMSFSDWSVGLKLISLNFKLFNHREPSVSIEMLIRKTVLMKFQSDCNFLIEDGLISILNSMLVVNPTLRKPPSELMLHSFFDRREIKSL